MSIFNNNVLPPQRKKKHWSFRSPDRRKPQTKEFLRVRRVLHVKPAKAGVYMVNGQPCSSFIEVKQLAKKNGFEIVRMGAISVAV